MLTNNTLGGIITTTNFHYLIRNLFTQDSWILFVAPAACVFKLTAVLNISTGGSNKKMDLYSVKLKGKCNDMSFLGECYLEFVFTKTVVVVDIVSICTASAYRFT